jgi:hypothetical protein
LDSQTNILSPMFLEFDITNGDIISLFGIQSTTDSPLNFSLLDYTNSGTYDLTIVQFSIKCIQ